MVATLVICERRSRRGTHRKLLHRGVAGGRPLCKLVGRLVAAGPTMCWDPPDGDIVVSCEDARADFDGRHLEALARAEAVVPHSVDGGGGADEHRVPVPALLLPYGIRKVWHALLKRAIRTIALA